LVIVFSHIDFFEGEAELIKQLFEKGLDRLHFKKLGTISEWKNLILDLPKKFYNRIVLHSNYELQKEFPDLQLHSGNAEDSKGVFVSSSSHSIVEAEAKSERFDYVFLSPLYTSLSKEKYSPIEDLDVQNAKNKEKIVALGGIESERLVDVKLRGFQHIALLGSIWNEPSAAVQNFEKINKEWQGLEDVF
jgi:thiamine-phosphate pyrophosphorylase